MDQINHYQSDPATNHILNVIKDKSNAFGVGAAIHETIETDVRNSKHFINSFNSIN